MRRLELRVAERSHWMARIEYRRWFDVHRRPQIEVEDAQWRRRQRTARRRWRRQRHERRLVLSLMGRREGRQERAEAGEVMGDTGGTSSIEKASAESGE